MTHSYQNFCKAQHEQKKKKKKNDLTGTAVPKKCDFGAPALKTKENRGAPQIGPNPYYDLFLLHHPGTK